MLARATLRSTMSLRVTCLQWFNAELRKAQSLTAVLVGELCKAAYDLLEAAAPLMYKQQQSICRYTAKLLSHITRATIDCDSQSRIVWPSEETRLLSLEDHTLISRQCRHLLKGELQRRWCLEFIIVCRLCQAAYTLLEAAPPLTIGQRRSMRRFTVNLQSHIKRVTRGCDSQSNDVWPREETSSLPADAEQDEEHKAKEGHTQIRRRRSDKRAVRVCAQHTKRDRTIDTGREGTPEKVQEQTAPDSK